MQEIMTHAIATAGLERIVLGQQKLVAADISRIYRCPSNHIKGIMILAIGCNSSKNPQT
jgi:hypothetical protein